MEHIEGQGGSIRAGGPGWLGQIIKSRCIRLQCLDFLWVQREPPEGPQAGEVRLEPTQDYSRGQGLRGQFGSVALILVMVAGTRVKGDEEKGREFEIRLEGRVAERSPAPFPLCISLSPFSSPLSPPLSSNPAFFPLLLTPFISFLLKKNNSFVKV